MNPRSLRATNFRSYPEIDLIFPEGCIAVTGTNGAGKSSLILALDVALFGARNLGDYLSEDAEDMLVEVELEHAGETYRIRRTYSARGRGRSATDFERRDDGVWSPLTRESQKATQSLIEETLGLSRKTLHASALLMQGDGGAFSEADPAERKRVLADILGLDSWDRLLEACRGDRREAERRLAEVNGRIALLSESDYDPVAMERDRDEVSARVLDEEVFLAAAEGTLRDAAEKVSELERSEQMFRARHAAFLAAEASLSARQAIVDRAAAAKLEAVEVQAELSEAGDPSARLAELEERRAEMDAAREARREREVEREKLVADAEDARRERERLEGERADVERALGILRQKAGALNDPAQVPHCDRCGQEIHGEAFERTLLQIRSERDDADRRVAAYAERVTQLVAREQVRREAAANIALPDAPTAADHDALVDEIREVRKVELTIGAARERLALLQRTIDEVTPELTAELARLAAEVVDARAALEEVVPADEGMLAAARADVLAAKARVDEVGTRLTESRAALARAQAAVEQAQRFAEELASSHARREELLGEADLLSTLERAFGRDGIPALIVEVSAIPQIETEANRILAELGTSYRVELRTQRALKSGDGLADTLDVVVIADAGERDYSTFSGGERTRVNLALRIALARLLAHRRGAESRLLCIDEPEFLDEAGTARLADVLRGLGDEFERIVLVSHVPTLRDSFDQTLEVVKEDGRSMVLA